jgi:hypothetical protein
MVNKFNVNHIRIILLAMIPIVLLGGCNSTRVPYEAAAKVVGRQVDHAQVAGLEKKLVGQPVQTAVEELGKPFDVLRDTQSSRQWYIFLTESNTVGKFRYVVEVNHDRVLAISKVEKGGVNELDIPRRHVLREKVMGKRPKECQKELGMGPPLLTVKSEKTGQSAELYDARLARGRQAYYCLVKYNPTHYCENLEFITVGASTKQELHQ